MKKDYIDILIEKADGMKYCDFCRLLSVLYWNLVEQEDSREYHSPAISLCKNLEYVFL